jgi:sugar phosphate isomerase/epimerase
MKLGCSTLLYGLWSQDDALAGIAQAGFDGIELASIPNMGFHLWPERMNMKILKKKLDSMGLVVESIGGSGNDPYDSGPKSRFVELMEAGGELGATGITTGSGGESGNAEDMKKAADAINALVPTCKKTGVKVSIKPHVGGAVHNTPSSLEFMQLVDTDWIGLNVDPSHLWRAQPDWEVGEESILKLADYIVTARLRDTKGHQPGIGPVDTQVPGGGEMNLQACMDAFKKVPGLDMVTVEIVGTANWSLDKIQDEVVQPTYDYLAKLV